MGKPVAEKINIKIKKHFFGSAFFMQEKGVDVMYYP